jgi:hypothetical protein
LLSPHFLAGLHYSLVTRAYSPLAVVSSHRPPLYLARSLSRCLFPPSSPLCARAQPWLALIPPPYVVCSLFLSE